MGPSPCPDPASIIRRCNAVLGDVDRHAVALPGSTDAVLERVGEVLGAMKELSAAGMTMVVVTHELGFARQCADWLVFMEGGIIVEEGIPADLLSSPQSVRLRAFLRDVRHTEAGESVTSAADAVGTSVEHQPTGLATAEVGNDAREDD